MFLFSFDDLLSFSCGLFVWWICTACNHPYLVSKDYIADRDAVEPVEAKGEDEDEDVQDLATVFEQLGMGAKKCQLCQTECVLYLLYGCSWTRRCTMLTRISQQAHGP